ncbi:MAG: tRNA 2-thiouridine(34) synthase MnmA [Clostridia bacterium]|nr:tRNA 2-thiouridine(34) synthase MnmA [Clostridia bacterium]
MEKKKVLVAMSGGVDSSAAAVRLMDMGYSCSGAIMKLYCGEDSTADAVEDARGVAEKLGMDFSAIDAQAQFKEAVMDEFVASYLRGETPNPCIVCNKKLKFGLFADYALEMGMDYIATGHYARVGKCGDRYVIKKGVDERKDQSYVLYNLSQQVLSRLLLPLGELSKAEVRALAAEAGLAVADKKESQDICFVPDGDYAGFIEKNTDEIPEGDFVLSDGKIMGRHKGIVRYTIGQHKKLGLGIHTPLYVLEKNAAENKIILGSNEDLFKTTVYARDVNWMACEAPAEPLKIKAKIRYKHTEQPATVYVTGEGVVRVEFDEPQRAVTPGQSVVFYDGDVLVGGGVIV